jgi:phage shock protein A
MMRIFSTLWRARAAEAEEAIFDANAIRLLQQNLREAMAAFEIAKYELARVMAQETTEMRLAGELAQRIGQLEDEARKALEAREDSRAEMLAGRIAVLEDERAAHLETSQTCGREARRIREQVDLAARRIAEVKRGLATASAVDALQRTRGRLGDTGPGGMNAIREAEATLKRIRERQQGQEDVSEAMTKIEGELPIAGARRANETLRHQTDPKDVLARLRRPPPPANP